MITVRSNKKLRDFELLLLSGVSSLSVQPIANIAQKVSWKKLWDNALNYGYKGIKCVQAILCELCRPTLGDRLCHLCSGHVECFSIHLCTDHPSLVCHHSLSTIIDNIISNVDMPFIITLGSSLCHITA